MAALLNVMVLFLHSFRTNKKYIRAFQSVLSVLENLSPVVSLFCRLYIVNWPNIKGLLEGYLFFLQDEVFPYPEVGNEELEEIKQLVAPVERFFREEGLMDN